MARMSAGRLALFKALEGLGIGDIDTVRRVVIDIRADGSDSDTVYVEHYADPVGTVEVIEALSKAQVNMVLASTGQVEHHEVTLTTSQAAPYGSSFNTSNSAPLQPISTED